MAPGLHNITRVAPSNHANARKLRLMTFKLMDIPEILALPEQGLYF